MMVVDETIDFAGVRERASQQARQLGFPHKKLEEWKYTVLPEQAWAIFNKAPKPEHLRMDFSAYQFSAEPAITLCFVDGHYVEGLSDLRLLPPDVFCCDLTSALKTQSQQITAVMSQEVNFIPHQFSAHNTAEAIQGVYLHLAKNIHLAYPIYCLYISTQADVKNTYRNIILAQENSSCALIERFITLGEHAHCDNSVTQMILQAHASAAHVKVISGSNQMQHVATTQVQQHKESQYASHQYVLSGGWVRNDVEIDFKASHASCRLFGFYQANQSQHVDQHTTIHHAVPNCQSYEYYKGIIDDQACAVFNGKVIVLQDAQQTHSEQMNKNILLADTATINTKPELQIYADDVQCRHGATVGQLDDNALFYLRSRGLSLEQARNTLLQAFANEIVEMLPERWQDWMQEQIISEKRYDGG